MKKAFVLPLLAAVGLSLAGCAKKSDTAADANLTADNSAELGATDNISVGDDVTANGAGPSLDNAAAPLDAVGNLSDNAADAPSNGAE